MHNGPKMDPCGTPHVRFAELENLSPMFTKNVLLEIYIETI